jgi:chemotaxis regulatin CheY-phosphate phosphatase CheZ
MDKGWTLGTLKEHLEKQIEAVEDAAKLALDAADKAATKADAAFEKRMDATNEWRGALDDQTKRMATIQMFDTLKERVESTDRKLDAMLNKVLGFGILVTFVVGLVAIFGGLLRS